VIRSATDTLGFETLNVIFFAYFRSAAARETALFTEVSPY